MLELGIFRGLITALTLLTFLGICWWAYRPASRERFDADAHLVFDDESPLHPGGEEAARRAGLVAARVRGEEGGR